MTRDEVLDKIDRMADEANIDLARVESVGHWPLAVEKRKQEQALRAAAELIRQSGWRPIAECGDAYLKHVGKWSGDTWKEDWNVWPEWAKANGYTHFFTEPEPPAREVPNDRG